MSGLDDATSRGRASAASVMLAHPADRRELLRGALALAGVIGLGGCRLRLEDDAPPVPIIPRRSIPDQDLFVAARRDSAAVAGVVAGMTAPLPPALRGLAAVHQRQVAVLDAALMSRGVARSDITGAPSPTSGGSAGSAAPSSAVPDASMASPGRAIPPSPRSGAAPPTLSALASAESALLDETSLARVASATALNRPLLVGLLAQRTTAATLLGATLVWPTNGERLAGVAAAGLLDQTRAAIFGLDIVTARSSGAQRSHAQATLAWLEKRRDEQELAAGAVATPPALSYEVGPMPATPAALAGWARTLLGRLLDAGLTSLPTLPPSAVAVATLVRWQAEAQVQSAGWSGPVLAFPGLRDA